LLLSVVSYKDKARRKIVCKPQSTMYILLRPKTSPKGAMKMFEMTSAKRKEVPNIEVLKA